MGVFRTGGWRPSLNLVVAVISVLAGVAAFFGARAYLAARTANLEQQLSQRFETRPVLVVSRDIPRGEPLRSDSLAVRQMPRRFVRSDSLDPDAVSAVLGRRLLRDLTGGDAVGESDLEPRGVALLSAELRSGLRALTIPVDEVNSLSGMLRAGDVIDLYYLRQQDGNSAQLTLLLEAVPVLATGAQVAGAVAKQGGATTEFATVTLQVTPDDAARVVLAQRTGQLTAVLRNHSDLVSVPLTVRDSRALKPAAVASGRSAMAVPVPEFVQLIVGGRGSGVAEPQRLSATPVNPSP
jgi:pilus assembly protein CpaB